MVLGSDTTSPKLTEGHFVDLALEGSVVFIDAPPGTLPQSLNVPYSPRVTYFWLYQSLLCSYIPCILYLIVLIAVFSVAPQRPKTQSGAAS